MLRWFKTRKKLLEEIKLQEKYIEALEEELRRHLMSTKGKVISFRKIRS